MKKLLFTLLVLGFSFIALKAQIISTFAGNYLFGAGYSGDGGTATDAELNLPVDVAFDKIGNLYIADRNNNVVRMVNNSGIISTIAGNGVSGFSGDGGPATDAEFKDDVGILIDSIGNIFLSDHGNERIRKINTAGIISTIGGNGVAGYSGDGGAATSAEMNIPCFMALDNKYNLFFADVMNDVIRKIDTAGIISTVAGNHIMGYSGDGGPAITAELNAPEGVAIDMYSNIFIADAGNYVIRKIDTAGVISTIAGIHWPGYSGDGGPATAAELDQPDGIIIDVLGNVYFADELNNVIRVVNTSGTINTLVGNGVRNYSGDGGPATAAELDLVSNLAFDTSGNMFLADEFNNVIREVTWSNISTGIDRAPAFQFAIFPNPTSNNLNLIFNKQINELGTISIMDIAGREIINSKFTIYNSQFTMDVSSLSSGIYFADILMNGQKITLKFIKV